MPPDEAGDKLHADPFQITKEQWVKAFLRLYPNEAPFNPHTQLTDEVQVRPAFDQDGDGAWITTWTWVPIEQVED